MPLSGSQWVSQFPTSVDLEDLAEPFRTNAKAFIGALKAAGASVTISATYRPRERAYLMHYAYRIAREGLDPTRVPPFSGNGVRTKKKKGASAAGLDIDWVHRDKSGKVDLQASGNAAEDMVAGYGIVYRPVLRSNHTLRLAVDMTISWSGTLTLLNKRGQKVSISSTPRSGGNHDLIAVGASYDVIKLVSDPPHWSADGH